MSNPNDKNFDDPEFSDDQFETQDLPEGEESNAAEDTVDFDEFPAKPIEDAPQNGGDASEPKFSDDEFETLNLPDGSKPDATRDTGEFEEFPAASAADEETAASISKTDDVYETVDLPDAPPPHTPQPIPTAADAGSSSDTAVNEAAEDVSATVIDPSLADFESLPQDSDAQTVEIDDQGAPSTAQTTFFDSDPEPPAGSVLSNPDTMQTVNTRDLSPQESEELQRTLVDDEMASAASIADGIAPDPPTDLRDSGTIPVDGPETESNIETQLVIQQRQLIETKPGVATATADYELLELLGEGGMGVVYAANQTSIDRQVAIKMLKAKYVEKKKQRDNFLSEAVVTGDLDHPNIVPIYDLGKNQSNALFYSMKRVKGTPWRDMLESKNQKENIEILLKVADAAAFAHSRGVIHRDLKPENVMLGDFGEVLVMDWGLALTTESFAAARSIAATTSIGCTPAYAAPELVRGPRGKIAAHSDIYLLGAILYQIVSGEPPHRGNNALQCLAAATGNKITPTEQTGELIDIALKAMATEPEDRHADVKGFQAAIREYLSHSESLVLAEHAAEDLKEADLSGEYNDYARAVYGFREALEMWDGNSKAKDGLQRAKLAYARCAQGKGDFDLGMSLLETNDDEHARLHAVLKAAKAEVDARAGRLKMARRIGIALAASILVIVSGAAFLIESARQDAVTAQGVAVDQKKIADDQKKIAVANEAEAVKQTEIAEDNAKEALRQKGFAETNLATAEANEKEAKRQEGIAKVNETEAIKQTGFAKANEMEAKKQEDIAKANAVEAKKQEGIANANAVKAKEQEDIAKTSAAEATKQTQIANVALDEQEYESYVASIGLAAERIAANNFKDAINILKKLELTSPKLIDWEWHRLDYLTTSNQETVPSSAVIDAVAFRPDGKAFVAGGQNGTAFIWDADSPDNRVTLNHGADVAAVSYSRSGKYIATGGNDGIVKIWDPKGKMPKLIRELKDNGHTNRVTSVVFAPDQTDKRAFPLKQSLPENWLLSTSYDETAILWNAETGEKIHTFRGHSYRVCGAAFSPKGDLLVTVGEDRRAVVWSLIKGDGEESPPFQKQREFSGHIHVNERSGEAVRMPIYAVAFSHDGNYVATGGDDERVRIWNPLKVQEPDIQGIVDSLKPGNKGEGLLNVSSIPGEESELSGHGAAVHSVSFSRDDRLVLSGSDDNTLKVWSVTYEVNATTQLPEAKGKLLKTLRGHAGWVRSCQFSPEIDSEQVLSGSHDGQARIWNVGDYSEQLTLAADDSADARRTVIDHDDAVYAVAFDRNSDLIVTAGRDQKARIWNARTGQLKVLLGRKADAADPTNAAQANSLQEGHAYLASTVIPFDNGNKILTSALENTTRIWDVKQGIELVRLDNTGIEAAAAVSSDGTLIATGSSKAEYRDVIDSTDGTEKFRTYPVRLWRTATTLATRGTPKPHRELDGHKEPATAVAFSPDGKFLCSGDSDGHVILWQTSNGKKIGEYRGSGQSVNAVLFSTDGKTMFAASDDGRVHIWNLESDKELKVHSMPPGKASAKGPMKAMALVPGQRLLLTASGGDDRMVRLWNFDTGEILKEFDELKIKKPNKSEPKYPLITGLSVSPDGDWAFAANYDKNTIHVIDIAAREIVPEPLRLGTVWSTAVYHTNDGGTGAKTLRLATVGGNDAQVWTVNGENGLTHASLETTLAPHDAVKAAAFSQDGKFVLTGGVDGALKMWSVDDGSAVFRFPAMDADGQPYHTKGITHVTFSKAEGSPLLLTASDDKSAILWSWDAETLEATFDSKLTGHTGAVNCAVFSKDGGHVLTASDDGTARIWDLSKKDTFVVLKGHEGGVLCGAFSPDGKWAVTGGTDDTARIWDTATGKLIKEMTGHSDDISSIDVSPRGTRILTGSLDKTAKLWDPRIEGEQPDADGVGKDAREILTLGGRVDGHTDEITSVSFSTDGLNGPIATGSLDGTAILWLAKQPKDDERKVAGN